jgi:hypothetical protein
LTAESNRFPKFSDIFFVTANVMDFVAFISEYPD